LGNVIVALVVAVKELYTGAVKFALVDTCSPYPIMPSESVEAVQLKAGEVTATVDTLTGVD
jgi:hypothetical protein